jgi:hypothetical protein
VDCAAAEAGAIGELVDLSIGDSQLMSNGPNFPNLFRRAAECINILQLYTINPKYGYDLWPMVFGVIAVKEHLGSMGTPVAILPRRRR